jgi:hypothetical protein
MISGVSIAAIVARRSSIGLTLNWLQSNPFESLELEAFERNAGSIFRLSCRLFVRLLVI